MNKKLVLATVATIAAVATVGGVKAEDANSVAYQKIQGIRAGNFFLIFKISLYFKKLRFISYYRPAPIVGQL